MKNSIKLLLTLLICLPFAGFSQSNPLDALMDQYAGKDGFYFLDLKTNLMSTGEGENKKKDVDKVINLKMISFNQDENQMMKAGNLYNAFMSTIDKSKYKGLIEVKGSGDNVEMMIRQDGDQLKEIIITVQEDNEVTLIAATGNFDLKDLAHFKNMKDCQGLQVLEKLCEE